MAVYLLNMGFSLNSQYFQNGSFEPGPGPSPPPVLQQSATWLKYQGTSPFVPSADCTQYPNALNAGDWGSPVSDGTYFSVNVGDYVVMRIFPMPDNSVPNGCRLRFTVVFGRGSDSPPAQGDPNWVQSPLRMTQNLSNGQNLTVARPVVDTDNSANATWNNPSSDGAWTYCIGGINSSPTPQPGGSYYTLNVGATVWTPSGPNLAVQFVAVYGHDPTMRVIGG